VQIKLGFQRLALDVTRSVVLLYELRNIVQMGLYLLFSAGIGPDFKGIKIHVARIHDEINLPEQKTHIRLEQKVPDISFYVSDLSLG